MISAGERGENRSMGMGPITLIENSVCTACDRTNISVVDVAGLGRLCGQCLEDLEQRMDEAS